MSRLHRLSFYLILVLCGAVFAARAEDGAHEALQLCLKKASDAPDLALAEAENWLKHGGGDAALLCRATAQFHRNEFVKSGDDFATLAAHQEDTKHASFLYTQAGVAYMRGKDYRKSESEYERALHQEAQDPDIWVDRATERAA